MFSRETSNAVRRRGRRQTLRGWKLFGYDMALLLFSVFMTMMLLPSKGDTAGIIVALVQAALASVCIFLGRRVYCVYRQVLRYGGAGMYLRLIMSDAVFGLIYILMQTVLGAFRISYVQASLMIVGNLLLTLVGRHLYQYMYERSSWQTRLGRGLRKVVKALAGLENDSENDGQGGSNGKRIKVAIVGAGRIGAMLAEELQKNPRSSYEPCCFVDIDQEKIGREIMGIPVISNDDAMTRMIDILQVQEVVFALPEMEAEQKKQLYEQYSSLGCKLKVYDFPMKQAEVGGRRRMREFDIEELLFRKPRNFTDEKTTRFYRDKCILISGGGGSIGSELCRQVAKMQPKRIVALDICENSVYDLQQQMRIVYGDKLELHVEIASVCDKEALEQVFGRYRPEIVIHAAAHKHVPLMEHNCCEAVRNNVFGTLNMVEVSEAFGVRKFIMVSTDKAVNPTNVMGATKRVCEMIVQSRRSDVEFTATRFGNVLGSNGSVIPLFQRQISSGGPITITDRRIIRYFMTIPEASQLVLQSGAMAQRGELYVLDMGKPIKILDLAENLIRLNGYEPYKDIDIVEIGLRPGEKLYEELLDKSETLIQTENKLIFIEKDQPLEEHEMAEKVAYLRQALTQQDDQLMKQVLRQVVTTYHDPEAINAVAAEAEEMRIQAVG